MILFMFDHVTLSNYLNTYPHVLNIKGARKGSSYVEAKQVT